MSNYAAFLQAAKDKAVQIAPAPLPQPAANEVIIKVAALAINPVDWKIQVYDLFSSKYPLILGCDVSGTVSAVGSAVTHFAQGDRVMGQAIAIGSGNNAHAGFQHYVAVPEAIAAKIPASLSFEDAAVVPLGLSTAAAGLYEDAALALERPVPAGRGKGQGAVVVWGGSSSVGSNAIQLAASSGYEVITTASPKNFGYVKELGASRAFDYNSPSVAEDIVAALKGKVLAGTLDSISEGASTKTLAEIVAQSNATKNIVMTVLPVEGPLASGKVTSSSVFAPTIKDNGVGLQVYREFLEPALANGRFVAAPKPLIVDQKGLEAVQEGMDLQRKGVSARKVVVVL